MIAVDARGPRARRAVPARAVAAELRPVGVAHLGPRGRGARPRHRRRARRGSRCRSRSRRCCRSPAARRPRCGCVVARAGAIAAVLLAARLAWRLAGGSRARRGRRRRPASRSARDGRGTRAVGNSEGLFLALVLAAALQALDDRHGPRAGARRARRPAAPRGVAVPRRLRALAVAAASRPAPVRDGRRRRCWRRCGSCPSGSGPATRCAPPSARGCPTPAPRRRPRGRCSPRSSARRRSRSPRSSPPPSCRWRPWPGGGCRSPRGRPRPGWPGSRSSPPWPRPATRASRATCSPARRWWRSAAAPGWPPWRAAGAPRAPSPLLAVAAFAAVRLDGVGAELRGARDDAALYGTLDDAVRAAGGREALLACGRPVVGRLRGPALAYALHVHKQRVAFDPALGGPVFRSRIRPGAAVQPAVPAGLPVLGRSARWEVRGTCEVRVRQS